MLFFILILTAVVSSIFLFFQKTKSPWWGKFITNGGASYYHKELRNKGGVYGAYIGVGLTDGCQFTIRHEEKYDRFFKNIGISREFQVGHSRFDHDFYIISDSEGFHDLIQNDDSFITTVNA